MDPREGCDSAQDSPESASDFIKRGAEAIRARGDGCVWWKAERKALLDWARQYSTLLPLNFLEQFRGIGSGAEHAVYHDCDSRLAVKVTHPNQYGHPISGPGKTTLPSEYFERLAFQNKIFGDSIRIAGVIFDEEQIQIVTIQPWITAHPTTPNPTDDEIHGYLMGYGFHRVPTFECSPIPKFAFLRSSCGSSIRPSCEGRDQSHLFSSKF